MPEPTSDQRRERARERKRKSRENPKVREAENERKREATAARATVRRQVKRIKNVKAAERAYEAFASKIGHRSFSPEQLERAADALLAANPDQDRPTLSVDKFGRCHSLDQRIDEDGKPYVDHADVIWEQKRWVPALYLSECDDDADAD